MSANNVCAGALVLGTLQSARRKTSAHNSKQISQIKEFMLWVTTHDDDGRVSLKCPEEGADPHLLALTCCAV